MNWTKKVAVSFAGSCVVLLVLVAITNNMAGVVHAPKVSINALIKPLYSWIPKLTNRHHSRFGSLDVAEEARVLELLLKDLSTAEWSKVDSDPTLRAKTIQLADRLHWLTRSARTAPLADCSPTYLYCLAPVIEQILEDQGYGLVSDFPDVTVYSVGAGKGEQMIQAIGIKFGNVELYWSMLDSNVLGGWIDGKRINPIRGTALRCESQSEC